MNESPENPQPTPPAPDASATPTATGDHGFAPVLSSEPAEAAVVPEPGAAPAAPSASSADAAASPTVPAAPEAAAPEAAAPEPAAPVAPSDPAPATEGFVAPFGGVAPTSAQPYPGAPGQAYPGAPAQAYPGAPADGQPPYAGAAPGGHPGAYAATGYDPNASGAVPPYGGYPGGAPAPKSGLSKGALFGIIGGALAVVLIIAAAIIVPVLLRGPAVTASDVVESYLTAVSEGDAEAALEYVDSYGDDALLTDEVLEASLALGAIDDIEVSEVSDDDSYESTVPVTFTIGGETISRDFQVYDYGDDDWQIADGLISLSGFYGFEGLGLTVNGTDAPENAYVFPGTYELALAVDAFTIEGDTSTFVVADDADAEALWDLRPALTEEGTATFRSLVRASIEECVALKTLTTPCGMDLTGIDLSGNTPVDGTVTRTITAEGQATLDGLVAEVSSGAVVTTYDSIDVDMTLQGEKDGTRSDFEVWFGGYVNSPKVDFSAETPAVVWE